MRSLFGKTCYVLVRRSFKSSALQQHVPVLSRGTSERMLGFSSVCRNRQFLCPKDGSGGGHDLRPVCTDGCFAIKLLAYLDRKLAQPRTPPFVPNVVNAM